MSRYTTAGTSEKEDVAWALSRRDWVEAALPRLTGANENAAPAEASAAGTCTVAVCVLRAGTGSTVPRSTVVATSSKVWPAALRPKTVAMPTSG